MFFKVMSTFLFFLVVYVFFIVAFGLAFYIMLHTDEETTNRKYIYFDSPWLALVKTSTMFVGELQFEDIPIYEKFHSSSAGSLPLAYVFFLTFVFLIVMVLMNLLNGLAVSDVAKIEEEAEVLVYCSRLEVILGFESIFLQYKEDIQMSILQKQHERTCFGNWIRGNFVVPNLSLCALLQVFSKCKNLLNRYAKGVLIFNHYLNNGKYTLHPNKEANILEFLYMVTMDKKIITEAKRLISERKIKQKFDDGWTKCIVKLEKEVYNLERKTDYLGKTAENLDKKVDNLDKKVDNLEKLLISINDKLSK